MVEIKKTRKWTFSLTLLVVCGALLALAALSLIRSRKDWRSRLAEAETGENP